MQISRIAAPWGSRGGDSPHGKISELRERWQDLSLAKKLPYLVYAQEYNTGHTAQGVGQRNAPLRIQADAEQKGMILWPR